MVDGLTEGAERILREAGATFEMLDVAGAFELPQAIRIAMRGIAALRRLRGAGLHRRAARPTITSSSAAPRWTGMMQVALQFGIALGTGLLTCDTLAQAEARSGQDGHNKGAEAAAAALLQIDAARRLGAA